MTTQSTKTQAADMLRKEAEQLLAKRGGTRKKQAEARLGKSGADLVQMPGADIEKLLFEFQVHQIELELQNEELKTAHQELSVSRDDFARIYDLSPVAYLTLDGQGVINKANEAAGQLLGVAKKALANKKLGKFFHSSDQDQYHFFLHDLAAGGSGQILNVKLADKHSAALHRECNGFKLFGCPRSFCSDNSPFTYVELRGVADHTRENEVQLHLAIADITEYKHSQAAITCLNDKLEQKIFEQTSALIDSNRGLTDKIAQLRNSTQQLQEQEAKLKAIFNAAIEGIVIMDAAGAIQSANTAMTSIFGYCKEELTGCSFGKLLSTSQGENHCDHLNDYLQAKAPTIAPLAYECEGVRKNGSLVPLDISMVNFSLAGVTYFTAVIRDVGLRKRLERQEKEHLDELAHVARVCLVNEMGSGIAHELNQPLAAIANYTQACLHFIGVENPDLDRLGEVLAKTHQQALKAGQIIRRVKDFLSHRNLIHTDTDINQLVKETADFSRSDLKQNNIKLDLDLAKNLPNAIVDSVQIEQVLLNLLRNSIDALIGLPQASQRHILLQTYSSGPDQVGVKVQDNGHGVADAQRDQILAPFFTTKATGMGMGLAISRSIIAAHGGVLAFDSQQGVGTTFYFTLPVNAI